MRNTLARACGPLVSQAAGPEVVSLVVRRILIVLGVLVLALGAAGAYAAWRDANHGFVVDPRMVHVERVDVDPDFVSISGSTISSASLYRGLDAEMSGSEMRLALRYSLLGDGVGSFDTRVPTGGRPVTAVYLVGGGREMQVYPPAR